MSAEARTPKAWGKEPKKRYVPEIEQEMDFFEALRVLPEEDRQFQEFLGINRFYGRRVNGTWTNA